MPPLQLPFAVPPDYLRRAGAVALLFGVLALVSLWKSRTHSLRAKLVWTVLIALVPFVGAIAWVLLGRERRIHRHPPG